MCFLRDALAKALEVIHDGSDSVDDIVASGFDGSRLHDVLQMVSRDAGYLAFSRSDKVMLINQAQVFRAESHTEEEGVYVRLEGEQLSGRSLSEASRLVTAQRGNQCANLVSQERTKYHSTQVHCTTQHSRAPEHISSCNIEDGFVFDRDMTQYPN